MKRQKQSGRKRPASPQEAVRASAVPPPFLFGVFHPSSAFHGHREDYVYMMGPQGLGYYRDSMISPPQEPPQQENPRHVDPMIPPAQEPPNEAVAPVYDYDEENDETLDVEASLLSREVHRSQFAVETQNCVKRSELTIAVLCNSQGIPHPFSGTAERAYSWYGNAVIEITEVLSRIGHRVEFAPRAIGGIQSVSTAEVQKSLSLVLDNKPFGSLYNLLREAKQLFQSAEGSSNIAQTIRSLVKKRSAHLIPPSKRDVQLSMLHTAPSQQFRSVCLEGDEQTHSTSAQSRQHVQALLDMQTPSVRKCPICRTILLGKNQWEPFAEWDSFCCGGGSRQHEQWHPLPKKFDSMVFTKVARVINCLHSPTTLHGSSNEGIGYRHLSYQAPVMTLSGQLYARFMRCPANCWFLHDASYDSQLSSLLKNEEQNPYICA